MLYWKNWFEQSRRAYQSAGVLHKAGEHYWCCFTCQQAAEMALKAALERRALDRMGHNLLELLSALEGAMQERIPDDVRHAARRLNRLYIPTRYPDAVGGSVPADNYAAEDADRAMQDARRILDYVTPQMEAAE